MLDNREYIQAELSIKLDAGSSKSICKILFEDIQSIDTFSKEEIDNIINRIINHEPIQYITGVAPFYGFFFHVDKNVLIPRPETEELVYTIEKYIKRQGNLAPKILDIGTGSGCIPITINKLFPKAIVVGIDLSEDALNIARANNDRLKTRVTFKRCDFLEETSWVDLGEFDIIISNPPYIPHREKNAMTSNVLDYEPHLALFVEDDDPLIFYRKIFEFGERHANDVAIFLECNEYNAGEVLSLFEATYHAQIIKDLQGKDRIVAAQKGS